MTVQESSGYDSSSTGSDNQQQQSAKNVIQVKDHRIAKKQAGNAGQAGKDLASERQTEKERERERLATLKRVKPDVSGSR